MAGIIYADIECLSLDDFKEMPTYLFIDEHLFTKISYHIQNQLASYQRKPTIAAFSPYSGRPNSSGTFEIIDAFHCGIGPNGVQRTQLVVP
jgi:hypothetical protein